MAVYRVTVTMQHEVDVDTKHAKHYPPEIAGQVIGRDQAVAMALFDANNSDDPIETYAFNSTVVSANITDKEH